MMPIDRKEKIEVIPPDLSIIDKILDLEASMLELNRMLVDIIIHPMVIYKGEDRK